MTSSISLYLNGESVNSGQILNSDFKISTRINGLVFLLNCKFWICFWPFLYQFGYEKIVLKICLNIGASTRQNSVWFWILFGVYAVRSPHVVDGLSKTMAVISNNLLCRYLGGTISLLNKKTCVLPSHPNHSLTVKTDWEVSHNRQVQFTLVYTLPVRRKKKWFVKYFSKL